MKRGAKICALGFVGILATALVTFLMMHIALLAVPRTAISPLRSRHAPASRKLTQEALVPRWTWPRGSGRSVAALVVGAPREERSASDAKDPDVLEAAAKYHLDDERSSGSVTAAPPGPTAGAYGCGVDRSFAQQCVGVSPASWQLHRSAQAVGRMTIDNRDCSGVLLGNTTDAYFLTAAQCLPWEGMVEHASVEFTNCIGSQVFTRSEVHHLNRELDLVVLKLATRGFNVAGHFGFLHMRASGPVEEEVVFVPHYTDGYAKRITIVNDQGFVRVRPSSSITTDDECQTATIATASRVQFTATQLDDTAVGAPVMSLTDYAVVGLHLCGGCKSSINIALSTKHIVDDLNATGTLIPAFLTKK